MRSKMGDARAMIARAIAASLGAGILLGPVPAAFAESVAIRGELCRPAWEWAPLFRDAINRARGESLRTGSTRVQIEREGSSSVRMLSGLEQGMFVGSVHRGFSVMNQIERVESPQVLLSGPGRTRTFRVGPQRDGRRLIQLAYEQRRIGLLARLNDQPASFVDADAAIVAPLSGLYSFSSARSLATQEGQVDGPGTGGGDDDGVDGSPGDNLVLVPLPPAAWAGLAGLALAGLMRRRV